MCWCNPRVRTPCCGSEACHAAATQRPCPFCIRKGTRPSQSACIATPHHSEELEVELRHVTFRQECSAGHYRLSREAYAAGDYLAAGVSARFAARKSADARELYEACRAELRSRA